MTRNILRVSLLTAACSLALSTGAQAAGFYIQEQSVRGLGSAFSGSTTTLDDASTIFFNPAGMTKLEGLQTQAGVHVLVPYAKVKDDGSTAPAAALGNVGGAGRNPYDPTPVPNGFLSYQLNDNIWAGVSVTAPFGLASDYNQEWFGRFDSTRTELAIIDVQPTIAYKINDMFSIGGGVNIQHASADLRNAVLLGAATEGRSQLEGDDYGFGYSLGMQFKPWTTTTFGLNYKSEVHHNLDGKIEITNAAGAIVGAGTLSTPGSAKLTTPDHLTFGAAHQVTDRLTLQGQAQWFGWNNFDAITAIRDNGAVASNVVQDYQNTWAYSIGAEYKVNDVWRVRGGLQFDETPTTDRFRTSRTPDGDRTWFSLGTTYSINDKLDLDLAGTYIDVADGTIDIARGGGGALGANGQMRAKTEGHVGIVAVGLKYKF